MKMIITTFEVPDHFDTQTVREYIKEALHSEGGNYSPGHEFFQLCHVLRDTQIDTGEVVPRAAEARRAALLPILGQRCIVRQPDSDPFLGVVIDHDSTAFCVRHAISKVDQWFVRAHVELLAP